MYNDIRVGDFGAGEFQMEDFGAGDYILEQEILYSIFIVHL